MKALDPVPDILQEFNKIYFCTQCTKSYIVLHQSPSFMETFWYFCIPTFLCSLHFSSLSSKQWRNNELSGIKAEPHPLGLLVNLRIVASKTGQCCITVVESQECRAKLKPLLKVKVVREFVIIFHEISHIQQV